MLQIDVKALRVKLDWSQERLAEYLGVDRSTVSRLESGGPQSGPVRRLLSLLERDGAPPLSERLPDASQASAP